MELTGLAIYLRLSILVRGDQSRAGNRLPVNMQMAAPVLETYESHQYFCPHAKSHKEATRSSMGVAKHTLPKVYRVHINAREPDCEGSVNQLLTTGTASKLKRTLPNNSPPPRQPVVAHGSSCPPLACSSANAHEGIARKKIRSDAGTKGAEDA